MKKYKHIATNENTKILFDKIKSTDGRSFDRILKDMAVLFIEDKGLNIDAKKILDG